tara:strand:- start:94 stop:264 length:171 start_codon:yes stop_codon:yes gene_type:complete
VFVLIIVLLLLLLLLLAALLLLVRRRSASRPDRWQARRVSQPRTTTARLGAAALLG